MKLYISGPMTGYQEHNFPAFNSAEETLQGLGHETVNPASMGLLRGASPEGGRDDNTFVRYMKRDIPALLACDGIVLLDGWADSRGAQLEATVARSCNFEFFRLADGHLVSVEPPATNPLPTAEQHPTSRRFHELLREMGELHNKKGADYGSAVDPFANVRSSSDWGIPSWVGAMIRATDKLKRLQTFARKGVLANEGAVDSFMDLAVYAIISRILYEDESETS